MSAQGWLDLKFELKSEGAVLNIELVGFGRWTWSVATILRGLAFPAKGSGSRALYATVLSNFVLSLNGFSLKF